MTDWRPVGWVLLTLGLVNSVWGAYELGAGGENSFLLLSGLGCLTIWLSLREELVAEAASDVDREGSA
jgi:hypothetical protein